MSPYTLKALHCGLIRQTKKVNFQKNKIILVNNAIEAFKPIMWYLICPLSVVDSQNLKKLSVDFRKARNALMNTINYSYKNYTLHWL